MKRRFSDSFAGRRRFALQEKMGPATGIQSVLRLCWHDEKDLFYRYNFGWPGFFDRLPGLHPGPGAAGMMKRLWAQRHLIAALWRRDLRSRYAGSALGLAWTLVNPLAQFGLYYFLFSSVLKVQADGAYQGLPFALWMLPGLLPLLLVNEAISRSPGLVLEQAAVVKRSVFPSELLALSSVLSALVPHLAVLGLLFLAVAFRGEPGGGQPWMLLAYLGPTLLLLVGIGWALSALNVYLRDIGPLVNLGLLIANFATPVFYPARLVPASMAWVLDLNPLWHLTQGYRIAILGRQGIDWDGFRAYTLVALAVFMAGGLLFRRLKPSFTDLL
jgi:lipopolysaccharide transport system permease protein